MTAKQLVLIGGGVRTGKSAFALERARTLGERRVFIATAQAFDDEMRSKIEAHRRERSHDFETVEEPIALPAALAGLRGVDVVVIDCITLWLSNLLLREESPQRILQLVDELTAVLERRTYHSLIVTNEVGMGVVPETALGRAFRDLCGVTHQRLARAADEVHLAVLGTLLRIKPGPVEVQERGGLGAVG